MPRICDVSRSVGLHCKPSQIPVQLSLYKSPCTTPKIKMCAENLKQAANPLTYHRLIIHLCCSCFHIPGTLSFTCLNQGASSASCVPNCALGSSRAMITEIAWLLRDIQGIVRSTSTGAILTEHMILPHKGNVRTVLNPAIRPPLCPPRTPQLANMSLLRTELAYTRKHWETPQSPPSSLSMDSS